jgi:hypothetical protein
MEICLSGASLRRVLTHFLPINFDMSASFVARLLALQPEKQISRGFE